MKKAVMLSVVPALVLLAACGTEAPEEQAVELAEPAAGPAAEEAPAATGVTDPQIAAIVVAANREDIATAELAQERGTDPGVAEFAQRMITDHTAVNQQASELVGRLGVTPEENETSRQLTQGGAATRERLSGLSGAEFDRAYAEHEVAYHQQVLDALDQTLIPGAQNAELRALLEQTRPAIEAHLEHARQLQASLEGA